MDADNVNKDVGVEESSLEELRAIVRQQQQVIDELRRELKAAKRKINQLQDQADRHPTERVDEDYSVDAEDKRRRGGRKKQVSARRGRRTKQEKIRQADRTENVLPAGVDLEDAKLVRERVVTRLVETFPREVLNLPRGQGSSSVRSRAGA